MREVNFVDFKNPLDYANMQDENIFLFRRNPETIKKYYDKTVEKRKGDISAVTPDELTAPNLYAMIGTDCVIPLAEDTHVKSFYFYRNGPSSILIYENQDGQLDCTIGTAKQPSMSLSPFSKQISGEARIHTDLPRSNAGAAWTYIRRQIKKRLLQRTLLKYHRFLDERTRKLMYRCRDFSSYFYNNVQRNLYRQQFIETYPALGYIFGRQCFNKTGESMYETPDGLTIQVTQKMREAKMLHLGYQMTELKLVDAIDRGEPVIDILTDYTSLPKLIVNYVFKKTPHAFPADVAASGAGKYLNESMKKNLVKEYWPKKRTEWNDFGTLLRHANVDMNHVAKKYNIQKKGWNQFSKKMTSPKPIGNVLSDISNDVEKKSPFLTIGYFRDLAPDFYKAFFKMKNNFDFDRLVKFDEYYHANESVARAQSRQFLIENDNDDMGALLKTVPFLVVSEEIREEIKKKTGVTFAQLVDEEDFESEGRKMGHCVGGYFGSSLSGSRPIFSLGSEKHNSTAELKIDTSIDKVTDPKTGEKVDHITYKVKILQHRAKQNTSPEKEHSKAIDMLMNYLMKDEARETIANSLELGEKHQQFTNPDQSKKELREYIAATFIYNKVLAPFFNIKDRVDPMMILETFNKKTGRPELLKIAN